MKRFTTIILCSIILVTLVACSGSEMTLDFSFGQRVGKYSGDMVNGLPHGQGKFVANEGWTYEGEFVNGHMEGEGKTTWTDGTFEFGTYVNDVIVPLSGDAIRTLSSSPENFKNRVVEYIGIIHRDPESTSDGLKLMVWSDVKNSTNGTIVYYSNAKFSAEYDDYVRVIGLVTDVDTDTDRPVIQARSVEVLTYIEAVAPTIGEFIINESRTQHNYTLTLQKIEFAETETRVYIKVENNGTAVFNLYSFNSALLHNAVQFGEQPNWEADYPQVEYGLRPGASTEGIVVFPAVEQGALTLVFNASTEDWVERIKPYEFDINADGTVNEPVDPVLHEMLIDETYTQHGYSVTLQKIEFLENETLVYLKVDNNGANNFSLYSFNAVLVQNGRQYEEQRNWEEGYPDIQTGLKPSASTEGIIAFPAVEIGALQLIFEASSDDWNERVKPYDFDVNADGTVNEPVSPVLHELIVDITQTQRGYSVTVQKIEFLVNETLVYLLVENDGANNFNLYSFNALLVQSGKQYEEQRNWDENYPQVQTGLVPGVSTEGIIAFPAIEIGSLQLTFGVSSDNYRERLNAFKFDIEVDAKGNLVTD